MATNDFIGFASNGNANIASQSDYAAAAEQGIGMQPGLASSALANKAWRQGANMAAALGEMIKAQGIDALDNGDIATLSSHLVAALSAFLLPLSGGTIANSNDSLSLRPGLLEISADTPFIDFHRANSDVEHTARIINDQNGRLVITVLNDTNTVSRSLNLNTSGEFTWDGENVALVSALALNSQNVAVEYTNKLQVLSKLFGATNGSNFTFDRPFAQKPCVILCQSNNLNGVMAPYDITTTDFKVYSSISLSAYGYYLAIGQGV